MAEDHHDPMTLAWAEDSWGANVESLLDRALQSQLETPREKRHSSRQGPAIGKTNVHNLGEALVDKVLDARMQTGDAVPGVPGRYSKRESPDSTPAMVRTR